MTDLDKLIDAVEAGEMIAWGIGSGFARGALGDNWHHGYEAATGSLDAAKALRESLIGPFEPSDLIYADARRQLLHDLKEYRTRKEST